MAADSADVVSDSSHLMEQVPQRPSILRLVAARLLVGMLVLVCAEVFSGASLKLGLWHPWTCLVTYWLYFAHFFFCTSMAIRTGRTSLPALYLWGVLFGLYESWITKVIWAGYSGDGKFAVGQIGPYGFSELSMVFFFHPVVSLILPLAVTVILFPNLRRIFPDLAWLTSDSRLARWSRVYLLLSFAAVMAINSRGPVNLLVNVALAVAVMWLLGRGSAPLRSSSDATEVVAFARWGFLGLCVYLALLYQETYFRLRPEALPSASIQLYTLGFYLLAILGLCLQRPRPIPTDVKVSPDDHSCRTILTWFGTLVLIAATLSFFAGQPWLYVLVFINLGFWGILGFGLAGIALAAGIHEYRTVE